MSLRPVSVAVLAVLAGCSINPRTADVPRPDPVAAEPVVSTNPADYLYALLDPRETGVTQVFDDGHSTYLQFVDSPPAGLMVFDENGKALPFSTGGHAVIVPMVRSALLIRTAATRSYAQAPRGVHLARVEAMGTEPGIGLPAELAAARLEILRAQRRLAALSAELDRVARGEGGRTTARIRAEIEEIQTQLNGVDATLVRAHFAPGSMRLALSKPTTEAILEAARHAESVEIRGRADASGSEAVNARLARARALSVRRMLVARGIAPAKLHVSYASGDYLAPNTSAAGRAQNRRVELVFVGVEAERLGAVGEGAAITPAALFAGDRRAQ
jgi:outer membrane protein OmpA-like peptidoglycan-associated protein